MDFEIVASTLSWGANDLNRNVDDQNAVDESIVLFKKLIMCHYYPIICQTFAEWAKSAGWSQ